MCIVLLGHLLSIVILGQCLERHVEVHLSDYPIRQSLLYSSFDDLLKVPRIGVTYAMRILEVCRRNHNDLSWRDIDLISGIGPQTMFQLKRFFYVPNEGEDTRAFSVTDVYI